MRKKVKFKTILLLLLLICLFSVIVIQGSNKTQLSLSSPNGKIQVNLSIKEKLEPYPTGKRFYYSILFNNKEIIIDSPLGLGFKDMPPLARDFVIKKEDRRTINETWETVCGKNKYITDHCNELHLFLEESNEPERKLEIIFRVYDDGVAFRYFLPEQLGIEEFRLTSERSEFHFGSNHRLLAGQYDSYISHQSRQNYW